MLSCNLYNLQIYRNSVHPHFYCYSAWWSETMVAMGGLVNAEPTYVAFHHVIRLSFIALLIPIILKKIV